MELIKKIKQSEAQARQIIDQAKADAAKQAELGRQNRQQDLAKAEQQRTKAIEVAVATARSQATAEVENLKAKAENERQQLRDKANNKMPPAVAKVMEYLRSHSAS
jgi:V/A-type H+-transporting ATPase subunit G/H